MSTTILPPALFSSIVLVRLHDLVEMEHFADLDAQLAGADLVKQFLKRHSHKILRLAGINREADGRWDHLHRLKIVERPFVSDQAGHAHDSALLRAMQRVRQRGHADQFQHLVKSIREIFASLAGNCSAIDQHLPRAAPAQQIRPARIPRRRHYRRAKFLRDRRCRQSHRRRSPANQQILALLQD